MSALTLFATVTLATVFAVAGLSKIRSPDAVKTFTEGFVSWGIKRAFFRKVAAVVSIVAEFSCATLLSTWPISPPLRLGPPTFLLAALTCALWLLWTPTSTSHACNCYGFATATHKGMHIVTNCCLVIIGIGGALGSFGAPVTGGGRFAVSGLAVISALAAILVETLYEALRPPPQTIRTERSASEPYGKLR